MTIPGPPMNARRRMFRVIAYIWAAPNTALGAVAGIAMLCLGGHVRVVSGVAEFHGGLVGRLLASLTGVARFGAVTLGHVIVGIDEPCLCVLRDHEHAHVRQCERWGLFFLPAYALSSLWECMHGRNAYWNNWFERQARALEAARRSRPATHGA